MGLVVEAININEEYYYYVRAVPKAFMEKETIRVNRINARVSKSQERGKD